ncbi:MAG: thiamine pyrophosphate-dependent dehydrogenase E1 component subunit alpha [candidate division Zixibacteria bacterium]|nr:thiamine pyrophosphate-dependent dehydrogenase E1 component subunit alpha [Candidatus Tariuqbacter arcticus]
MLNKESRRKSFYRQMLLVRRFEERVLQLFTRGELFGTTHTYIGQEANAVAVLNHLEERDIVFSNHRCHGHYLVRTGDAEGLFGEMMGKAEGICGGRGGSQHLCRDNFFSNGILGSTAPIAAGMTLAEKLKGSDAIGALFLGDGALGEGIVYETLNLISLWKIPLLIVVENNYYAQTTPLKTHFAGSFTDRAKAFHIEADEFKSNDVEFLYEGISDIVEDIRRNQRPRFLVLHTYRLSAHSKGDDFRPADEIKHWTEKDPLKILKPRLKSNIAESLEQEVKRVLSYAEEAAREMPFPSLNESQPQPEYCLEMVRQ